MNKLKFYWNGEPVTVQWGYVVIQQNHSKPLMWYNYNYHKGEKELPAGKVSTNKGQIFLISNLHGLARLKLIMGGWPNFGHFSFPDNFEFREDPKVFEDFLPDQEGARKEEEERRIFFKKKYPTKFAQMEKLEKVMKGNKF